MSHFFLVERDGKSPAFMTLSRARKRGVSTVTKRWARGAMGASCHKASDTARTAKSCGPDARIAGVKFPEANASRGRWWQEAPIHQGEHDISRKAIAQGRPECFR